MAGLRNTHGQCPPEVLAFLMDLFKYSDNSKNQFSDNYYRESLIDALAASVSPSLLQQDPMTITSDSLPDDIKKILAEVTRFLNLEKLLPCYKYTVTCACLRAIRVLQKNRHLPPKASIFKSYTAYPYFIDIRLAAVDQLVCFLRTDGTWEDLEFLLNLTETDPVPLLRYEVIRRLSQNPPFTIGQTHHLDTRDLVERLWNLANSGQPCDSRVRCAAFDLYFALYGRRRPVCVPVQVDIPKISSAVTNGGSPSSSAPFSPMVSPLAMPSAMANPPLPPPSMSNTAATVPQPMEFIKVRSEQSMLESPSIPLTPAAPLTTLGSIPPLASAASAVVIKEEPPDIDEDLNENHHLVEKEEQQLAFMSHQEFPPLIHDENAMDVPLSPPPCHEVVTNPVPVVLPVVLPPDADNSPESSNSIPDEMPQVPVGSGTVGVGHGAVETVGPVTQIAQLTVTPHIPSSDSLQSNTEFAPLPLEEISSDSFRHKSKKKKKDKKHKKHKKHKHEHKEKDKLEKLDKFITEENLSSGSSNPPSPASGEPSNPPTPHVPIMHEYM